MNNITHLINRLHRSAREQRLTTAERIMLYSIQDLCIDISLQTDHAAFYNYSGHVHTLRVGITPPEHLSQRKGGDDTFTHCWQAEVRLPPHPLAGPDPLQELGDIVGVLEGYLPTRGGAA